MENQLVTILRITTPRLGNFAKNKLEEEGIEIFFTNEGLTLGSRYNPDEVLLKVKAGQSEKAVKVLLQLHKDYDLDVVALDESIVDLKKILVPVKISENCVELCRYAMSLAAKTHAEVKLLYVYPDPSFHEPEKHTASWEKHVKLELMEGYKKAQLKLVNFSKELKQKIPKDLYYAAKVHYRMLKGTPQNVIEDACKRYKPDVIVMGSSSKNDKSGEFEGKTLVKVLEHSNTPILSVPTSASFKGKEVINVMYATNFNEADNTSLNKLLDILEPFKKNIRCVHIDNNKDPNQTVKVQEINKMLEKEYSNYKINCEIFESSNISVGIDDFVKKNDIDIISLSKTKHSALYKMFHANLLEQLVTSEKVPMLIFPVK